MLKLNTYGLEEGCRRFRRESPSPGGEGAFPITAPVAGIALMNQSGKEVFWYPSAAEIPKDELQLIEEELA